MGKALGGSGCVERRPPWGELVIRVRKQGGGEPWATSSVEEGAAAQDVNKGKREPCGSHQRGGEWTTYSAYRSLLRPTPGRWAVSASLGVCLLLAFSQQSGIYRLTGNPPGSD